VKEIAALDTSSPVLLKASEVEKGMASGRPTISLASIHEQAPEIFAREVPPGDKTQVPLPFSKVLDEFTKLQVRADQVRQAGVPQVETPFLKVALEDNKRFGVTNEEFQTADLPPVKVDPPTAESFAAAEPEPAMEAKASPAAPPAIPKIPFSVTPPAAQPNNAATETAPAPAAPTRIPFKISPNGTDVPANESVPASGGPSVPNLSAAAPTTAPKRIPFKIPAPVADGAEAQPKTEPWLTAANFGVAPREPKPQTPAKAEAKIRVGLKTVLQSLPEFQRTGDASSVPADVRMELPFAVVEPQLASGRISIAPAAFAAAIPESFRGLFQTECGDEVVLPLQEVLKNLPAASLRMRDDQVEQEVGANFETPFSTKAEEDAKRFNVAATPIEKPEPVAEAAEEEEQTPNAERPTSNAESLRTPLQVALGTDEKLDAKGVVSHINRLPGVKASSILFCDGLNLAGSLPAELEAEGLCAIAPGLVQRIENHITDTKLGALRGMTLACSKGTMTFFVHENLCLAALHSNGEIAPEVRERLSRVVHEMSRKYSHPV
jgi:predicted regulator of Ras-like GTPase activity (Roadblock/LC7/MglB family)